MRHTLVALMEDRPAALNRMLGLLRGRALIVHSVAFGESKAEAVRAAVEDPTSQLPVAQALRAAGRALVFVDPPAAKLLAG